MYTPRASIYTLCPIPFPYGHALFRKEGSPHAVTAHSGLKAPFGMHTLTYHMQVGYLGWQLSGVCGGGDRRPGGRPCWCLVLIRNGRQAYTSGDA